MNINFSCRYKRKDISSAPPSGILRFLPPCSVHHKTSQLYACSFSSPNGQRCRDGCYGDTLVSPAFYRAPSNSVPDFHFLYLILVTRCVPLSLPRFLILLPLFPQAFWDFRTTLKRCSSASLLLVLNENIVTLFITLDKFSKFSGNMDSYRFFIECHCCISNIMFQFFD